MSEATPTETQDEPSGKDPVRRITLGTLLVVLLLIVWYLIADRVTPSTAQARVQAYVVPIAPEVSGRVVSVEIANNQVVNDGQTLLTIDDSDYRLALARAEADDRALRQELAAADANIMAARASVDASVAAQRRAQQDYERMKRIREEDPDAVSTRRLESAEATFLEATSSVARAQATLDQAIQSRGPTDEDNPRLLAARLAIDTARLNLSRTTVNAPGPGLVTDLSVDAGNFAGAGAPLMTFIAIHDTWISADFTENNLGNVRVGDEVELVLDVAPGSIFEGRVRSIGFGVSTGEAPLGALPTVQNDRTFLREAQRFPVIIDFVGDVPDGRRVGSQVDVIIYTGDSFIMNTIGALYIRLVSLFAYAY